MFSRKGHRYDALKIAVEMQGFKMEFELNTQLDEVKVGRNAANREDQFHF